MEMLYLWSEQRIQSPFEHLLKCSVWHRQSSRHYLARTFRRVVNYLLAILALSRSPRIALKQWSISVTSYTFKAIKSAPLLHFSRKWHYCAINTSVWRRSIFGVNSGYASSLKIGRFFTTRWKHIREYSDKSAHPTYSKAIIICGRVRNIMHCQAFQELTEILTMKDLDLVCCLIGSQKISCVSKIELRLFQDRLFSSLTKSSSPED